MFETSFLWPLDVLLTAKHAVACPIEAERKMNAYIPTDDTTFVVPSQYGNRV